MENKIKELIEKYEKSSHSAKILYYWQVMEDLQSLLELYQSRSEVDTSKEIPTIHDTIYHIGDK